LMPGGKSGLRRAGRRGNPWCSNAGKVPQKRYLRRLAGERVKRGKPRPVQGQIGRTASGLGSCPFPLFFGLAAEAVR